MFDDDEYQPLFADREEWKDVQPLEQYESMNPLAPIMYTRECECLFPQSISHTRHTDCMGGLGRLSWVLEVEWDDLVLMVHATGIWQTRMRRAISVQS